MQCNAMQFTHDFPLPFMFAVTATSSLPETVDITAKVCALWYICYSDYTTTDFCSALTSADGSSTCPGAGTYTFANTVTSPGSSSSWDLPSWLQGYTFAVTVTMTDASSASSSSSAAAAAAVATTCTGKASTMGTASTTSEGYSSTGYQQFMCGVGAAALVAAVWARRRQLRTGRRTSSTATTNESLLEMEHIPNNDGVAQELRTVV